MKSLQLTKASKRIILDIPKLYDDDTERKVTISYYACNTQVCEHIVTLEGGVQEAWDASKPHKLFSKQYASFFKHVKNAGLVVYLSKAIQCKKMGLGSKNITHAEVVIEGYTDTYHVKFEEAPQ
ncbi:MAG: hypothetical protein OXR68_01400 [Alphaproteobacteria bacterium]|nr:hypothetical protein [Alphaproteobacteria bacterium]MDD9919267.1 hypothetical protein [Alphaproteobacteria bacterium]